MVRLTEDQIDYIFEDIKANGVVLEDLQHNLLDHICCIIENEMSESDNFYKFYKTVLPRFFKKELKEIQEETDNLLMFKNYYAMKNTLKISGIMSSILTILGAIFKTMHWPGANICIVLGAGIFSLVFLPLMIALKFKDEEKKIDKWVFSFGFLIAMFISTGVLFKVMHWPGANILMRSGLTAFVFIYVPLYYFSRVRRAELAFNTTVNSVLMMACGGLLYALYNLGYSSKVNDTLAANYDFINTKKTAIELVNQKLVEQKSNDTLTKLHQVTSDLVKTIEDIKVNLISIVDHLPKEKAAQLNPAELQHPTDVDMVRHHFGKAVGPLSYENLLIKVKAYNELIEQFYPTAPEKKLFIDKMGLDNTIVSILLPELTQIQLQLVNNENSLLSSNQ